MRTCAFCGQKIRKPRSSDISRRFHAHVTWATRELAGQLTRDQVYQLALLNAVEMPTPAGADPYRYSIVEGKLYPVPTSSATNKEMMTACEGLYALCADYELGLPPEREDLEKLMEEVE